MSSSSDPGPFPCFEDMIETSPVGLFRTDPHGAYSYVNRRWCEMTGIDPDTASGDGWMRSICPEDRDRILNQWQQAIHRRLPFQSEYRVIRENGEVTWMFAQATATLGPAGNILGYAGALTDVTRRKFTEAELQRRTHELGERIKELNCLYEISKTIETHGFSSDRALQEIVKQIPGAWQYPDIACARITLKDMVFQTYNYHHTPWRQSADIIVSGRSLGMIDVCYLEERPALDEGPFQREERHILNAIAERLSRLIERSRTIKALHDSEERFRIIFDGSRDAVLIARDDGTLTEVNDAAASLTGYEREALMRMSLIELLAIEDTAGFRDDLTHCLAGESVTREAEIRRKRGASIRAELSIRGFMIGDASMLHTVARDITDRKLAEQRIHTLTQQLIEAQEAERQSLSRDLHDNLAQDLSSLKIAFETLFDPQAIDPMTQNKILEISKVLEGTIRGVRDLARYLRPPSLDTLGLVQTIDQYCREFNEKHNIRADFFSLGIDNVTLGFYAEINIYRLIQEALNNVRKHARAQNVTVRLAASFPKIILRVEDDGQGFDLEKRRRASIMEKRMGLQGMEERVKLLGGRLKIRSRPGKGTRIHIEFPYTEYSR